VVSVDAGAAVLAEAAATSFEVKGISTGLFKATSRRDWTLGSDTSSVTSCLFPPVMSMREFASLALLRRSAGRSGGFVEAFLERTLLMISDALGEFPTTDFRMSAREFAARCAGFDIAGELRGIERSII
jgi:hypothetical protein